jgi:hypothetical protein
MRKVIIQVPIWKDRSVGIAEEYGKDEKLEVEIAYRDKKGVLLYPDTYEIAGADLRKYPKRKFGNTPPLYIVPIKDLPLKEIEVISEDEQAKRDYFRAYGL